MSIFIGTDICEISRIEKLHKKYGKKFLKKIFTENEINYCLSKKRTCSSSLTARFATKEAVSKALGAGLNGLGWKKGLNFLDIEIIRNENGNIGLKLHNSAKKLEEKKKIKNWAVSISHGKDYAVSTVIGYR